MATIKNIIDSYTINVPLMQINGNLVVNGGSTNVDTTNTSILDNVITLNKGEQGNGISLGVSGIEIDRGIAANVAVRFNEDPAGDQSVPPSWQATEDGVTWKYLLQGATPGGMAQLSDDLTPALGGNLNITSHTLYDTNAQVTLFANTVSGGGSGIYSAEINGNNPQELVTKSKALAFSIIFG